MAGFNDRYYGIGVSMMIVTGTGGTLLVPEARGVVARNIYAHGGTMHLVGYSQAIGVTNALPIISDSVPIEIWGPAAFVLLSSTDGAQVKVVNFYTQSGIPNTNKAT